MPETKEAKPAEQKAPGLDVKVGLNPYANRPGIVEKVMADFKPRRLKLIIGSSRGNYLADADTGEDLRLPIMSMNVDLGAVQSSVHCTFSVTTVEKAKAE